MGKKTINQALKDLFLGLGGDSSALADNSSVSDYIEDLESAIKGAASGVEIDDTTASTTTVYSSSKTEDLVNSIETLPSVAVGDIGEALIVESDGEGGAQWGKGAIPQQLKIIECVKQGASYYLPITISAYDINQMIYNGEFPVIKFENSSVLYLFIGIINDYYSNGKDDIVFARIKVDGKIRLSQTNASISVVIVPNTENTTKGAVIATNSYNGLPYVTASDNDKILKVVNGVWTAVTP